MGSSGRLGVRAWGYGMTRRSMGIEALTVVSDAQMVEMPLAVSGSAHRPQTVMGIEAGREFATCLRAKLQVCAPFNLPVRASISYAHEGRNAWEGGALNPL